MSLYNSIRSTKFLLYFIICITTGCAQKATTKHAFVNEPPTPIYRASYPQPEPARIFQTEKIQSPVSENELVFSVQKKSLNKVKPEIQTKSQLSIKPQLIQHKTVWDRMLSLYSLPEIENQRIDKEVQRYLKHPEFLANIQKRAEPYLYFILNEIEAKQIPGELALLPVVESAFKPAALSKSKASGLWQFMPATGRLFGLKQNWWYDGRRDIYTSTKAATTYLKQLNNEFDDNWLLAIASYNAGKGTVRKAIKKNKKASLATDYWSLGLKKETMIYVPRLLAIAKIFANAEKYNIPLQDIPNKPYFSVVKIDSQLDLNIAADLAQTPIADFFTLNPAFKKGTTDPDGPFHLLIHTDKAEAFKQKLAKTVKKDRLKWIKHKIKSGENLGLIAKKYNTTVNALRQSNKLASTNIRTGKFILIPASPQKSNKKLYTVKKGDTFWDIARQFAVKSKDIAIWNNISLSKALQPGQKLIIEES